MRFNKKLTWMLIGAVILVDAVSIPIVLTYAKKKAALEGEAGVSSQQADTLPVLYPVPDFAFTAQDGQPFSKAQLAGKVWVADVFFTSCAGPCPVLSTNISELSKQYAATPDLHFASFTVDPDTDTPAVLTEYGKRYHQDPAQWTFLTGPIAKLQDLAKNGFKLGAGDSPLIHSEHFVLVDRKGNIRGYFVGTDTGEVAKLKGAIDRLLKEAA